MSNLGQALLVPTKVAIFIKAVDAFTDTDGVALTTHNPAWIKHPAATNTAAPVISNNRIRNENLSTVSVYYRNDFVPAGPNYRVQGQVILRTITAGFGGGVTGRVASGSTDYYLWRYQTATNAWQLYKIAAGVSTLLGTFAQSLTIDQPYLATLVLRGPQISGLVDGVTVVSVVDTAISAPGFAGLRLEGLMSATTGIHLDTWQVSQ